LSKEFINRKIITSSHEETKNMGKRFAQMLSPGDVVAFSGELGSGKTTLIQGICGGLGVKNYVRSPCFVIINEYNGKFKVYHFDLYRLDNEKELEDLGYEEYFYGDGVCLVEWAEKAERLLPGQRIQVNLKILSERKREIQIKGRGAK
jgi:tRNA threonylcarbamoyladenosine biosynthesis protein TsaE